MTGLTRIALKTSAGLLAAALCLSPQLAPARQTQGGADAWYQIGPRGERFTVRMPAVPRVYVTDEEGDPPHAQIGGQEIKRDRTYHAYHDGAIFLVRFYKASKPERLLRGLIEGGWFRGSFVREFDAGGVAVKEYEAAQSDYYVKTHFYASGEYLYQVEAAAREPGHPHFGPFFASFRVGGPNPNDAPEAVAPAGGGMLAPAAADAEAGQPYPPGELTRRAKIHYRPEPLYTDEARRRGVRGAVDLRVVFGASGEVTNVIVVRGLSHGLTESAVAAARNVRFLPAEKDGRRVSQFMNIQYNFNIY